MVIYYIKNRKNLKTQGEHSNIHILDGTISY